MSLSDSRFTVIRHNLQQEGNAAATDNLKMDIDVQGRLEMLQHNSEPYKDRLLPCSLAPGK